MFNLWGKNLKIVQSQIMSPLELWYCICMEKRDSSRRLPNYSIYPSQKLVGLILQTFEMFVWKKLQQWRISFRQIFSCTILTLQTDLWLKSLQGGVSGTILILYGYYVKKSHIFSRPMVCHRVISSSKRLSTWSNTWPLPKKDLYMFFQGMCINCKKHCLTK